MANLQYFPPIKPSAIALGVAFKTTTKLLLGVIVEGTVHHEEIREILKSDKPSDKSLHDKTVTDEVAHHSSGLISSAFQTYAIAALLNATGTLSYKGAAYVGAAVYFGSSVPGLLHQTIIQERPFHIALIDVTSHLVETVGLSLFLNYWGIHATPLQRKSGNIKFSTDF